MNSDDPNAGRDEVHRGHELESGLLTRVREWTDVFPWIRLGRTLRVAGSPPLVLLTAVIFAVWWFGQTLILGDDFESHANILIRIDDSSFSSLPRPNTGVIAGHLTGSTPTSIFNSPSNLWGRGLAGIIWSMLLWAPAAMFLSRQGALLTAGRTMVGLKPGISHVIRRTPAAWLAALVPFACVMAMGLMIMLVGWIAKFFAGVFAIEVFLAVVTIVVAIPCGLLAFGANVAVPLSWVALANERDPDALDSLSRGFEYLLRRPLRLVWYGALSLGILWVIGLLASGVASAAIVVAAEMLALTGCSPTVLQITHQILQYFPTVVVLTLLWSLLGGVYLLLRYDAGGQEVEDLWQPTPQPTPSLPELPQQ
jgi:hypothetical protein